MSMTKRPHADSERGLLQVIFAAVLWGTVGVTTKSLYTISNTNPLSVGFFRLAFSLPALLFACGFVLGRRTFQINRRDLSVMVVIGGMTALYQVAYFSAIERVGVAVATLVTLCVAPVIVALLSAVLTQEKPTPLILLALVCALAGTALLINFEPSGEPDGTGSNDVISGVLLALGSATGYAVLALCSRSLAVRWPVATTLCSRLRLASQLVQLYYLRSRFLCRPAWS